MFIIAKKWINKYKNEEEIKEISPEMERCNIKGKLNCGIENEVSNVDNENKESEEKEN